jgi:hypothetical protein
VCLVSANAACRYFGVVINVARWGIIGIAVAGLAIFRPCRRGMASSARNAAGAAAVFRAVARLARMHIPVVFAYRAAVEICRRHYGPTFWMNF